MKKYVVIQDVINRHVPNMFSIKGTIIEAQPIQSNLSRIFDEIVTYQIIVIKDQTGTFPVMICEKKYIDFSKFLHKSIVLKNVYCGLYENQDMIFYDENICCEFHPTHILPSMSIENKGDEH